MSEHTAANDSTWTIVDSHMCTRCGYLDRSRDGIMAHLAAPCVCDHEWTDRGSGDFAWRECRFCGEQTPYETRVIPPEVGA